MKHLFKTLAALSLGLALVACKKETPEVPPVFKLEADASFNDLLSAAIRVSADKAVTEEALVQLSIMDGTTFATGAVQVPQHLLIEVGQKEASGTVTIAEVPAVAGDYKVVIGGSIGNKALEPVTISFTKDPAPAMERVVGWYSSSEALWTANVTAISITHPDGYGMARSLAMDDEYIYLPKMSGYPALAAIKITDPTTQAAGNVSGVNGGKIDGTNYFACFVRMMKNTDGTVNGGKDILVLGNVTSANAAPLTTYAYTNGFNNAPAVFAKFAWDSANEVEDWRRYGDRFCITGTWQSGKIYLPSFNPNKSVILSVANGERTAVQQIAAGEASPAGIKDVTVYPGSEKIFLSNNEMANLLVAGEGKTSGWDNYVLEARSEKGVGTWGYNFFEFNGKKYIAYARISGNKAWVEIIADKGDLLSSLAAQEILFKAPIHSADNLDTEHATGGVADCAVRVIGDVVYIAALTRDGGMVVDKLYMK